MIVDTSAIVAFLRDESDATAIGEALDRSPVCRMSAATYVEAGVVIDGNRDPVLSRRFDDLLRAVGMKIESVTLQQARIARQAYRDFGKGRHKASLNFGDCFAYALAKELDEPLLCKGDDFRNTDVEIARP
jgi:ribonuclease VapC